VLDLSSSPFSESKALGAHLSGALVLKCGVCYPRLNDYRRQTLAFMIQIKLGNTYNKVAAAG